MRTRDLISADLARTMREPQPRTARDVVNLWARAIPTIKGVAIIGFRLSHHAGRHSAFGGAALKQLVHLLTGADLGYAAKIGPGLRMQHPTGVGITGDAVIGSRCTVHTGCTVARSDEGAPVLGDDVIIAPGARVIGTVNVDDGCHVAANAVLVRSIPGPWMVLGGVPAKPIRERQRLAE